MKYRLSKFGEIVREFRWGAKLSLKEMSRQMDVNTAYMCSIEHDRRALSPGMARRYVKMFEKHRCSTEKLCTEIDSILRQRNGVDTRANLKRFLDRPDIDIEKVRAVIEKKFKVSINNV